MLLFLSRFSAYFLLQNFENDDEYLALLGIFLAPSPTGYVGLANLPP